jgi:shikimate kinase
VTGVAGGGAVNSRRHIVLVGLPGCGKTTVGRLVAAELGARFVDIDIMVAEAAGRSIPRIFEEQGEEAFRLLERRAVLRELAAEPAILAPGGGWAARAGNLEVTTGKAVTIYLMVSVDEALRRVQASGADRPLLAVTDPRTRLQELLAAREPFYRRCQVTLEAGGRPSEDVGSEVVKLARSLAGW